MRFASKLEKTLSIIAGPSIYCGLGVAHSGSDFEMVTTLSIDVKKHELELLASCGIDLTSAARSNLPSLVLDVDALNEGKKTAHLGNPLSWGGPSYANFEPLDVVIAANGDPYWLMTTLSKGAPKFLAIDLHIAWIRSRRTSLQYCIEAADFVSGTIEEFGVLEEVNIRPRPNCVKVIKNGNRGVTVADEVAMIRLPPPKLQAPLKCDIGAGDFILGLLVGTVVRRGLVDTPSAGSFATAYEQCVDHLLMLLNTGGPAEFYRAILEKKILSKY